jgi:hypothetical protein
MACADVRTGRGTEMVEQSRQGLRLRSTRKIQTHERQCVIIRRLACGMSKAWRYIDYQRCHQLRQQSPPVITTSHARLQGDKTISHSKCLVSHQVHSAQGFRSPRTTAHLPSWSMRRYPAHLGCQSSATSLTLTRQIQFNRFAISPSSMVGRPFDRFQQQMYMS